MALYAVISFASIVLALVLPVSWWVRVVLVLAFLALYVSSWLQYRFMRNLKHQLHQAKEANETLRYDLVVASDRLGGAMAEVGRHSKELQQTAEDTHRYEMDLHAESQAAKERIERAFDKMQGVKGATEEIHQLAGRMETGMSDARQAVAEVVDYLQKTDAVMNELQHSNEAMQRSFEGFVEQLTRIGEMNEALTQIVEETSLLSLNASIESARLGEHGQGFAVVASRMRQLADQCKAAVESSAGLLSELGYGVRQLAASVEEEKQSVGRGIAEVDEVQDKVAWILTKVTDVGGIVQGAVGSAYRQEGLIHDTAEELHMAVDSIAYALANVERTLGQLSAQREQIGELYVISDSLLEESAELKRSIGGGAGTEARADALASSEPVRRMQELLAELVALPDMGKLEPMLHERELSAKLDEQPEIQAIWSNRADGTFIYSRPKAGLLNAQHRDWWRGAMEDGQFVSKPYVSAITKRPCITISRAILDEGGAAIGVIGVDLSLG